MSDILARMRQIVGTTQQWADDDLVLADGEIGIERRSGIGNAFKVGNGVDRWSQLPYSLNSVGWGAIYGDITDQADLMALFDDKADLDSPVFTGTVVLPPTTNIKTVNSESLIGYGNVTITSTTNWGQIIGTLSAQTDLQAALDAKQVTLVSGTNIKTVNGNTLLGAGDLAIATNTAVWGNITGTLSAQTDLQNALNLKANLAGPTFTGTVTLPTTTSIGPVDSAEIGYLNGVTGPLQPQIDAKAPTNNPTFTGTVTLPTTTNLKTVGGQNLVGTGDIPVGGGGIPEAPLDGLQYGRQNAAWTQVTGGGGGSAVFIGDNPPPTPGAGQLWWESDTGNPFIWYIDTNSSQWVPFAAAVGAGSTAVWGGITGTLSAQTDLQAALNAKQATLVSGTNIKTINGNTLLGSGDLVISGGGSLPPSTMAQFDTALTDGDFVFQNQAASVTTLTATGVVVLDNTLTTTHTSSFATGATASGSTKNVNIGANGVSGSTTSITYGSSVAGATVFHTFYGTISASSLGSSISLSPSTGNLLLGTGMTTGQIQIGSGTGTGTIDVGLSTANQTVRIAANATTSGNTKNVQIGTTGASGSTTNITYGSAVAGATVNHTFNGTGTVAKLLTTAARGSGNNRLSFFDPTGEKGAVGYYAGDEGLWLNNALAQPVIFGTNDTERMRITAAGSVGIGTATPASKLHVNDGYFTSSGYGASPGVLSMLYAKGTAAAPTVVNTASTLGYISGAGYDGTTWREAASMAFASEGAISSTSAAGSIAFNTAPAGSTVQVERMRINSAGTVFLAGAAVTTFTPNIYNVNVRGTNAFNSGYAGAGIAFAGAFSAAGVADFAFISGIKENLTDGDYGGALIFGTRANGSGATSMEKMRIRSNGNTEFLGGIFPSQGVSVQSAANGGVDLAPGTPTSSGYIRFTKNGGVSCGYIGFAPQAAGGGINYQNENGGPHIFNNGLAATPDGTPACGQPAGRWSSVFAVNGTIQTSDEREKDWIGAASEPAIRAAGRIIDELGFFTWLAGADDQIHYGVRAQQVLRILMEEGLEETQEIDFPKDAFVAHPPVLRHAFVTFSTWEEQVQEYPPAPDGEGREPTITPAGNHFGMNLAELGLFVSTAQHARMNALEARLVAGGL